jgi:hypothetical protein
MLYSLATCYNLLPKYGNFKKICADNVVTKGQKAFVLVARPFFSCHVAKFCQKMIKSLISTEEIVKNMNLTILNLPVFFDNHAKTLISDECQIYSSAKVIKL